MNTSEPAPNGLLFGELSATPEVLIGRILETHQEMAWLAGEVEASPESSVSSSSNATIGQHFYPAKDKRELIEFDRTAVGILTLDWVMAGDYARFTECQSGEDKLTPESFETLREFTKLIIQTPEDLEAMQTFMVINDLGKIKKVIETILAKTGVQDVDHDKVLIAGLEQQPEISPSFIRLSSHHQQLILNGIKTEFNIGQFIQGENVPASLTGLQGIDNDSLNFYLLHTLYDIAGAAGQAVQNGSVIMNEPTYQNFRLAISALEEMGKGTTPNQAYDMFISAKGAQLGLDIQEPRERAVTRLCCMLRTTRPEQALQVLSVFESLPDEVQSSLEQGLNKNGNNDGYATLIYYAPALLVNLTKKYLEDGYADAEKQSYDLGLKILSRIFFEAGIMTENRTGNGVFTVMAAELARIAAQDPQRLLASDIHLIPVGNDAEIQLTA